MNEENYMRIALDLAKHANPSPNPRVGCIIVKDGKVISSGYHKKAGEEHAEISALNKLEHGAEGATMYVTLEPCSHEGKGKRTGPCTKTIIESGIRQVVCAMKDPNARVDGAKELRKNGIEVKVGLLEQEARKINETYVKYISKGMPFVTLKCACSIDGKIATAKGESEWISSEDSRALSHKMRAQHDAIMVGIGTVLKDNPRLNVRMGARKESQPKKIIIDSRLRISTNARLFRDGETIIATSEKCDRKKMKKLKKKAEIIVCGKKKVELKKLMRELAKKEITSILLEGGSELNGSMLKQNLIDKVHLFMAPKIIGGKDALPIFGGEGVKKLGSAIKLINVKVKGIGEDISIEGYLKY
jgi:diaminohydroxyphosphoribosylaminopyrimidine deaminase/5-amino-6-(5-phosphoribosylamino)uracil reductase